jgi:anti-sigma regulatory factor (Ser/Thr protein kinase)
VLRLLDGAVTELDDGQIATCIYGIVEPHTGLLTLASAGHPPPLVVAADGLVSRLYMEVGTPLGLGRDDAKEYTVRLHRGSLLALFTDGLVESRVRDIDAGVSDLATVLSRQSGPLDARVDGVLAALGRDEGHDDDVALMLVRLPEDSDYRVLEIEVGADPADLGDARARAHAALADWAVPTDAAEAVVLVVSELLTNALVHGGRPTSARLLRTGSRVVVEVRDSSSAFPRRRHAEADDENGRGLELVSLLATRWGSRATAEGKAVWAELAV